MAYYGITDFQNKLLISDYTLELSENLVSSQTGSGQVNVSSVGPRLWKGTITITQQSHDIMAQQIALVRRIQNSGNFFVFTPPKYNLPQSGGSFSGYSPVVNATPVAGYTLTVTGMPPSYVLTAGDYLSFSVNSTHRLHQVAVGVTATAGGVATIELVNPIMANSVPAAGAAVVFSQPRLTCRYVPASMRIGRTMIDRGETFAFDFIQSTVTT